MEKETIEEALNSEIKLVHDVVRNKDFDLGFQTGGIFGAKWQAERMYSEEDMREAFIAGTQFEEDYDYNLYMEKWFEQLKKK
jgi:hypothetical protein